MTWRISSWDAHFLALRLRLFDVPEFVGSFRSLDRRLEALRLALLKGWSTATTCRLFSPILEIESPR